MLAYESYFLITLMSILGPVLGVLGLFFYNVFERKVYLLKVENRKVLLEKELEIRRYLQLSQQIQPHFLFNALNSLYGLLRLERYDKLSKSFEHMVLYLRSLYNQENDPLYKVREEISHTRNYLEIQKLRFGERLHIKWNIDEGIQDCYIVQYLLITLVENAFKHGLEHTEGNFCLSIKLQKKDDHLQLLVNDNGPGFKVDPFIKPNGIGLENVKKQLAFLYDSEANIIVSINDKDEIGGEVKVTWPLNDP